MKFLFQIFFTVIFILIFFFKNYLLIRDLIKFIRAKFNYLEFFVLSKIGLRNFNFERDRSSNPSPFLFYIIIYEMMIIGLVLFENWNYNEIN